MSEHPPPPLASLFGPHLDPRLARRTALFGNRGLSQFKNHLAKLYDPPQWFAFVDPPVARCFTRFRKLDKAVKNPRSITGSQKYIAAAKNSGFLF